MTIKRKVLEILKSSGVLIIVFSLYLQKYSPFIYVKRYFLNIANLGTSLPYTNVQLSGSVVKISGVFYIL